MESALKNLLKERMDDQKERCKRPWVCTVHFAELKQSRDRRATTQCVSGFLTTHTQRYPHKNTDLWSATLLQLCKTVATPKVTKMQYSWKDKPAAIWHYSENYILLLTNVNLHFHLLSSQGLPAYHSVSDEIWTALLSSNQICWEQHLNLIESWPKLLFQRTQRCHRWKEASVVVILARLPGVCEKPRFDEKWQQARFTFLG